MIATRTHVDLRARIRWLLHEEPGLGPRRSRRRRRARLLGGIALGLATLVGTVAFAVPPPPSDTELLLAYAHANPQAVEVVPAPMALVTPPPRDEFDATPGIATFVAGGTNHDWAKLVLLFGGWPISENNVTVMLRWMRQENYVDSWWNRNNPLNNGWGSGGGGGTGSYSDLVTAAQKAAENLHRHPGFQPIVDAFAADAPTHVTEAAIWASPWASGHYANGAHWHYNPVPVVKAPASAWGR